MPEVNFTNAQRQAFRRKLLAWYDKNARTLPWRVSPLDRKQGVVPDPYRVWLSEIMLQQTTVATVGPRFQVFLDQWPTVLAMANASEADILEEWAGLGYYARARNLLKCAKEVAKNHNGLFPEEEDVLRSLPGIGEYTAAAISAIAFDKPAVVVDGNIERVGSRVFAIETPLPVAKPEIKSAVAELWPKKRSGDFAQSLMDLGATICTPKNAKCDQCPVIAYCDGNRRQITDQLPVKKKKTAKPTRYGVVYATFNKGGDIWLIRRPDKGLLAGTLGLPGTEWTEEGPSVKDKKKGRCVARVKHTFTHFHLELDIHITDRSVGVGEWANVDARLPTVMRKAINAVIAQNEALV